MAGKSTYTDEMADAVCTMIATGHSLRSICEWDGMPNITTVLNWLSKDEDFAGKMADAREAQADHYADQIIEIADESNYDDAGNGNVHVQRSKLRVDARKWVAGKLRPKRYGDRIQTDITSGGKPIKNEWHIHPVSMKPTDPNADPDEDLYGSGK